MIELFQFYFPTVVALSFGPSFALLYLSLSRYTYPKSTTVYFDDRWIFILFSVGIVLGALLYYIELRSVTGPGGLEFLAFFLIVQELIVLVILNFPRMRRKGNSRYYGFSLGLSLASGVSLGEYGVALGGSSGFNAGVIGILFVYTIAVELVGSSTGSILGLAIERSRIPIGVVSASAIQIVFNFISYPALLFRPSLLTLAFDLSGLLVGLAVYLYAIYRVLPQAEAVQTRKRFI